MLGLFSPFTNTCSQATQIPVLLLCNLKLLFQFRLQSLMLISPLFYTATTKKSSLQKFIFSATLTLPKSFKKKGKEKNVSRGEALGNSRSAFGWFSKRKTKRTDCKLKSGYSLQPHTLFSMIGGSNKHLSILGIFFCGKTSKACFDPFNFWQMKPIAKLFSRSNKNHFSWRR